MISINICVARLGANSYHNWIGCVAWRISFRNCQCRSLFRNILTKSKLPTKSMRTVGLYFVNIALTASQKAGAKTNEMLVKTRVAKGNFFPKAIKLAIFNKLKEEHSNKSYKRCNEQMKGIICWNLTCCHESKTSAVVLAELTTTA
ncbi:hypothetical protein M9H77_26254 [Catharanthus roseus]|uniref:Uncharacterized protein n=1 Tax=Catharanthus roseus TaxID=4058 RepID=A0ACC0A9L8_CATRO|nr:hypothetical protein M9H77_26254 [Catharanthus roseus]